MLLGEARSKTEHLAGSLLKPQVAADMNQLFLAKGAHATTAIEGNTLSEAQAQELLRGTLRVPPSQEYLVREVQNIVDACNAIKENLVAGAPTELEPALVRAFNRQVLDGLDLDEDVVPGEIREHSVTVGRYRAVPAAEAEALLDRLCEWLNGPDFEPSDPEWKVPWALIKAVVAHLYIAWIHPFGDGNGRTARLVELQILLAAGMPMPASHLLSNHYNETRSEYYRQLDRASASGGDVVPFLRYGIQGFVDGIRTQLSYVKSQQFDDRWEQFVYETFGHTHSVARERRRRLVLEMSKHDEPIPRMHLPRLAPELTAAYAGTERMLSRDLNALRSMNLIERVPEGWQPKRHQILAFLPIRRDSA
jgi:Fic family protein